MSTHLRNKLNEIFAELLTIKFVYSLLALVSAVVLSIFAPSLLKVAVSLAIIFQIILLVLKSSSHKNEIVLEVLQACFTFSITSLFLLHSIYNQGFNDWLGYIFKMEFENIFSSFQLIVFLFFAASIFIFKSLLISFKDLNSRLKDDEWKNTGYMHYINLYSSSIYFIVLFQLIILLISFKFRH
jgi:hypothetical protein